jgi:hypothetical protein
MLRLVRMHGRHGRLRTELAADQTWREAVRIVTSLS